MSRISAGVEQAVRSSFDFNRRGAQRDDHAAHQPHAGGQRPLRHRPHAASEHQVELRRAAGDRPAVSAGAPVERGVFADSRHAQRFDRAEQRKPDRRRRRAGGAGASDRRSGSSRRSCRDSRTGGCRVRARPSSCSARASGWRRAFRATVTQRRRRRSSSTTCRRASGSLPAATRPCAASRSIGSARRRRSTRTASRQAGTA